MFAFQLLPKQLKTCRPNAFSILEIMKKFKKVLDKSTEGWVFWWLFNPVSQMQSSAMKVLLLLVCSTDWEWSFCSQAVADGLS